MLYNVYAYTTNHMFPIILNVTEADLFINFFFFS